jgi:hypothetical protein
MHAAKYSNLPQETDASHIMRTMASKFETLLLTSQYSRLVSRHLARTNSSDEIYNLPMFKEQKHIAAELSSNQ